MMRQGRATVAGHVRKGLDGRGRAAALDETVPAWLSFTALMTAFGVNAALTGAKRGSAPPA
jgi:hypothetical protein